MYARTMLSTTQAFSYTLADRFKGFYALMKFRLSALVVFSAAMTFLLAVPKGGFEVSVFVFFCVGSFFVTAGASAINHILEADKDSLMQRTKLRPLPTHIISASEAWLFSGLSATTGGILLYIFVNPITAYLSIISLLMYAFLYTPFKPFSSFAVIVGAFPGAMPPLIGWVAGGGSLYAPEAWVLFSIQFVWQFPHYWAIAWVLHDDYSLAGFRLLPGNGERDSKTAITILVYTAFLLPLGMLPTILGLTGSVYAVIAFVAGALFLLQTFILMRDGTVSAAKRIMFGSFLYLPIVQIAMVLDRL